MTFNLDPETIYLIIGIFTGLFTFVGIVALFFICDSLDDISRHLNEQNQILKEKKGKKRS